MVHFAMFRCACSPLAQTFTLNQSNDSPDFGCILPLKRRLDTLHRRTFQLNSFYFVHIATCYNLTGSEKQPRHREHHVIGSTVPDYG